MKPPRLVGRALRAVRIFTDTGPGARIARAAMGADFGFEPLLALPASARAPSELEPRPRTARAPRAWGHEAIEHPASRGHRRGARALREAFARGAVTPTELFARLEAQIVRGDFGEAVHSPFVALDLARGRAAAAASTARYRAGTPRGLLDGVPVPIKDQHDMAGLVTRGGTSYRTTPASRDGVLPRSLEAAGAVLYAKTHSTEWGMTSTGYQSHFDVPRNPYSRAHAAGGSSTGAAVAAALGLATVASGSDGGGSIRTPASLNGVYGIKPTFGRVGHTGDLFGGTVGVPGPIAQGTLDLAEFLAVAAGAHDPDDPTTLWARDPAGDAAQWLRAPGRGVRGCTIGVPRALWADAPAAVAWRCRDALAALERDGAVLRDVEIPLGRHALAMGTMVIGVETLGDVQDDLAAHADAFGDDLRLTLAVIATMLGYEYLAAQRTRASLRAQVAAALGTVDVLALPSVGRTAPPYALSEDRVAIADTGVLLELLRFAFLANLTGLPAGGAPVGLIDGLPIGMQIVGDAWDEASVLAVLAALERTGVGDLPKPAGYFDLLGA